MSVLQSSGDHLTLNADGSSKNILFQADGVQKASISSAGLLTSTTIDATVLTGNLPAISGASLTGVTATDSAALPKAGGEMSGNITMAGAQTVDGRDLSADGTKLDTVETNADVTDAGNVGSVVNGKQTIWVPSTAMTPTISNGCAAITGVETTAGRPDMQVLDFDHSADEHAQFTVAFPKMWNEGTVTFQVFWSGIAATTDVDWFLQGVGMVDNNTIDLPYGTAVVVTDSAQGAVEELYCSAESGAITIAGSGYPAVDGLCYFRIGRDVSGDDMAGDARLHGIKLFFTTDALNDA